MEDKQKINCTVENCKYNNIESKQCVLKAIVVEPGSKNSQNNTTFEEQSLCGSFVLDNTNEEQQM